MHGNSILDENNNPININGQAKGYSITENGSLVVEMTDGEQQTINLGVTLVNKPQFLVSKGDNLLGLPDNLGTLNVVEGDVLTNLEGVLRNQISIKQGALEQSNVDLSKEMTDLITVQRSYQFQSRSINLADQMMGLNQRNSLKEKMLMSAISENSREAIHTQNNGNDEKEKQSSSTKRIRLRLIPIWLRVIMVTVLFLLSTTVGAAIGYGVLGNGKVSDIFTNQLGYMWWI